MEMIEYVKLVTAFIVSIGGSSVVIIALTKWFGNFLSTRLLDAYNNKHEKELEVIKTKYASELENTNSKIKRFWGTTENAVRIQISVAIITYCLVAIVQHDMQLKRSTYEVLQILSISLTDKTHLRDLFNKTNFNDVKELDCPLFEGLFD